MNRQLWKVVDRAVKLSPELGRLAIGTYLGFASPFNGKLHASVEAWEPTRCRIRVPHRRGITNHLGGVHAGALATAGETPAGVLILRSFPFDRYRIILKDLSITYARQARGAVVGEATITEQELERVRAGLEQGEPQLVPVITRLSDEDGSPLAEVKTTWQLKAWEQVRGAA